MTYDPRTIAFLAFVQYQPINLAAEAVQGIHNTLFQRPEISYHNFQVAQDGIHLSNLPNAPGAVSSVVFQPHQMVVSEELRSTTLEDFATRLVNVVGISMRHLRIPAAISYQFVIRSLVTPRHVKDSREFLSQRLIAGGNETLQGFGRPLGSMGLRFSFPPHEDHVGMFNVQIEPWMQDPRSVWIENHGQFTDRIAADDLPQITTALTRTYRFLTGQVCEFIQGFDIP
jgi:hypothetical protein